MKIKNLKVGDFFQTKYASQNDKCPEILEVIAQYHENNLTIIERQVWNNNKEDFDKFQFPVNNKMEVVLEQLCYLCLGHHEVLCEVLPGMKIVYYNNKYYLSDDFHTHDRDFLILWDHKPSPEPYPVKEMEIDEANKCFDKERYKLDREWNEIFDTELETTINYGYYLANLAKEAGWDSEEDDPWTVWLVNKAGEMIKEYEKE